MCRLVRLVRGSRQLLYRQYASSAISSGTLVVSPAVREAIANSQPVVALESTIITHGMPYPTNLSMAREVEAIIASQGAVPATIALFNGKVYVGLTESELGELASSKLPAVKTSRRDFPYVLASKSVGGTTVSGTMVAAHAAGIQIFVTGGIGGVHRGACQTMDISADLTELGRTPVMVVSAGVKSILDIGLTLEYLETQGVCVAVLGETNSFPAFYTPDSGFRAPCRVGTPLEAARLLVSSQSLGLTSGILLAVPIPAAQAGSGALLAAAIDQALAEANAKGVAGRDITPFILSRLNQLTGGESLRANLALVKNNALVGGQVAVQLAHLKSSTPPAAARPPGKPAGGRNQDIAGPVVVGGCNYDIVVRVGEDIRMDGSTHSGDLQFSHGGVGRNLADALCRLAAAPVLVSAVGGDPQGQAILAGCPDLDTSLVRILPHTTTATYTAILDREGECRFGVGNMRIHEEISPSYLFSLEEQLASAPLVVSDGNIPVDSLDALMLMCGRHHVPFFYEPTCPSKAVKPLASSNIGSLTYCSPNLNELVNMGRTLAEYEHAQVEPSDVAFIAAMAARLLEEYGMEVILATMSRAGVLLVRRGDPADPLPRKGALRCNRRISGVHYPGSPVKAENVISVSGAGDCLTAGFLAAMLRGADQHAAVAAGMQAARLSCLVSEAVPTSLSLASIDWNQLPTAITVL